jgi:hypothetical protein
VSKLQRLSALGGAAAILCAATAASADDGQQRVISTTAAISLTIAPSAVVGVRSNQRNAAQLVASANGGSAIDDMGVSYTVRDSRGERVLVTLPSAQAAIAESRRCGERDIDVTLVF